MRDSEIIALALGLGAVAGLRSMTAPALVTLAVNRDWIDIPTTRLDFLRKNTTASLISALAIGELVVDKLPFTPNRTAAPSLTARILTGALSAAVLSASINSEKIWIATGAILGGIAAVAGAFIGMNSRRKISERFSARDTTIAIAEDAIAVGSGVLLLRSAA